MTTVDKASGAPLLDVIDDRTLVGAIDVCPTAAGIMLASLKVDIQSAATPSGGGTTTRVDSRDNIFSGHVDDQAVLGSVTHEVKDKSSWESSSGGGKGGFEWAASNLNWSSGDFNDLGNLSGVRETAQLSGDAERADFINTVGNGIGKDVIPIRPAVKEAQRLWRNGRCVIVMAPDYSAETPISVADQEKMQHDEKVAQGSVTKFGANLRHRFGSGGLNQPVTAKLASGDKKVEPGRLDAVPGNLSYTAPDEADKKAAVQLKSVSKRGIGTLVIGFNTGLKFKVTIQIQTKYDATATKSWLITGTIAPEPTSSSLVGSGNAQDRAYGGDCGAFTDYGPTPTYPVELRALEQSDGSFELQGDAGSGGEAFYTMGTFPGAGGHGAGTLTTQGTCGPVVSTFDITAEPAA